MNPSSALYDEDSEVEDSCCIRLTRKKNHSRGPKKVHKDVKKTKKIEKPTDTKDIQKPPKSNLMELINLQKSNGAFEVSDDDWGGCILEQYLGSHSKVNSNCPPGIPMQLWITALSIKILEIKMGDEKDLWDLVMRKSQKFIREELNKIKEDYEELIDQAEKFVKSK